MGARRQRLAVHVAEWRLGISGVLDRRLFVQALLGDGAFALAPVPRTRPGCSAPDGSPPGAPATPLTTPTRNPHEALLLPGACSLAPHIALSEAGVPYTTEQVDLRKHALADGTDYYAINPKGYVPLLELDDGTRISEVAVILQYIADRKPGTLAPAFGTIERYRVMEWLNFIATELHKQFGPLWYPTTPDATRDAQKAKLATRFDLLAQTLAAQPYLTGWRSDRRRIPLHDPQLGADAEGGSRAVARAAAVPGARRRAPGSARGARRRGPGQGNRRGRLSTIAADRRAAGPLAARRSDARP